MNIEKIQFKRSRAARTLLAAAAFAVVGGSGAWAGTSTNTAGPVQQGQSDGLTGNPLKNNPAVTIAFSGQTALRNFNTSGAFSTLQPGTTLILHNGINSTPVTYIAPANTSANVQLAAPDLGAADVNPGTPASPSTNDIQLHTALRIEWHEQGSVDGFYDLVNDQIGFTTQISNNALRGPSTSNPTWVNGNKVTVNGSSPNGFFLGGSTVSLGNTYDSSIYDQATGQNLLGGQNRIQFSVGENPVEAVAFTGTASVAAKPGAAGYGQGNPALKAGATLAALGTKGARQTFQPAAILNESTDKVDPQTGSNYASGPWNTATTDNVTSTDIAATAVTFSANPGTGLKRINKGDAQWLQTTGRLENGALFNVVARTVNTGQRIVFAANTDVDPSWAVGSNDDGNSTSSTAAAIQHSIGSGLRFSGKTSGTEAALTIGQSRMAAGALSIAEARGASSAAPVRALDVDFNDLVDPLSGGVTDASKFIRANFDSITSDGIHAINDPADPNNGLVVPRYQAVLISHYNTIKAPSLTALNNELTAEGVSTLTASDSQKSAAWAKVKSFDPATAETDSTPSTASVSGIKGDPYGDVAAVISNIVNSNAVSASGVGTLTANANNPADGLESLGFLPTGLLNYTRDIDGGAITPVTLSAASHTAQNLAKANYGVLFTSDNTAGSNAQTIGASAFYGGNGSSNGVAINGNISITAKDSGGTPQANGVIAPAGNYLFGNFNQNGVRDYSAVQESVNAALSLRHIDATGVGGVNAKSSIFTVDGGVTNSTVVTSLSGTPGWVSKGTNTKGDLITLGDFNGDGKFDGTDVYLLAKGASLADSASSTTLTATAATFADAVRNPNAVLRKNAALDYVQSSTNSVADPDQTFLRKTAESPLAQANDAANNYLNAFRKEDVNRDGLINRQDAQIVDYFTGKNYHNLNDELSAVVRTDINPAGTAFTNSIGTSLDPTDSANASIARQSISLVDAELNDTGDINEADFSFVRNAVGSGLFNGDANFDGQVDLWDVYLLAQHWLSPADRWSYGDFDLNGTVNAHDLTLLAQNWQAGVGGPGLGEVLAQFGLPASAVPEPALAGVLPVMGGIAGAFARRRRRST
ncbi:MAG TPA: dockerin type I domain-containing protein [Tepidisphaeraceae bacterium]|nr:dockerin type I domain-containing protein [Tepidisphaeraceae bacterium]